LVGEAKPFQQKREKGDVKKGDAKKKKRKRGRIKKGDVGSNAT
jgi:hypothetical protein